MADYTKWSARALKEAGGNVQVGPLLRVAELLALGETKAREIDADLREALSVLTGRWSGNAAAAAHARTTGTARDADGIAGDANRASSKAADFAKDMADAAAEVRAMVVRTCPTPEGCSARPARPVARGVIGRRPRNSEERDTW